MTRFALILENYLAARVRGEGVILEVVFVKMPIHKGLYPITSSGIFSILVLRAYRARTAMSHA